MSCVRVGGLEAFATDIDIPLKYGVDQCVGDTICAGGILYGQRNIPVILDFCKDIREVAEPGALFLNYANPMAMNTWAAIEYGKVDTIGLCHGVQHGGEQIAEVLGAEGPSELEFICSGINHQTWYIDIRLRGRKIEKDELIAAFERHPVYSKQEKVRIDVLKRFGVYSTEVQRPPERIPALVPQAPRRDRAAGSTCATGSTARPAAICATPPRRRNWFETDFPEIQGRGRQAARRTSAPTEHASYIIEALETGRVYRGHFNVSNNGIITNLPDDAIIESPGFVDRFGINMAAGITLPLACAATCNVSIGVQRMSVEAAMTGDVDMLKLAVLHDPLVGAICTPEEVWQMVDEMLVAPRPSGCRNTPTRSRERRKRDGEGAARREVRPVETIRADTARRKEAEVQAAAS